MRKVDIVVIGAGLIGSSVALHLSRLSTAKILVLDIDLEGSFSSSELNAGGVRAIWNQPANSKLSKFSIDYFASVADQIGFRQNGYFWMFSKENWPPNLSADVEFLTPQEITQRYPFIDKVSDLGGAVFSPSDGLLNPNLLKLHYRQIAKSQGVEFVDRCWVQSVNNSKHEMVINCELWPRTLEHDELRALLVGGQPKKHLEHESFSCSSVVNCTGAWAQRLRAMFSENQAQSPLSRCIAVRRQASIFECRGLDLTSYGMFVDASSVYFHAEANHILGGYAIPEEPEGYNFDYEGEAYFQNFIWPALYERSSKFEELKHINGWSGLYEVSPDKSAIIGKVPGTSNVYEAHSFSGRGAMQSYGAGLGLAELIIKGRFETLDLSEFSPDRFYNGRLLSEGLLI